VQQAGRKHLAPPKLTRKELVARLRAEFPQMAAASNGCRIEKLWRGGCRLRQPFSKKSLRPGGTISGPTLMALADFAMYLAVLSAVGWVPLAVTINLTINFVRRPAAGDLIAEAELIKLGRQLAVGEIRIRSVGTQNLVAHAVSTYAIPPRVL
jgi:uncharacterized protein (TIGR00369 family)